MRLTWLGQAGFRIELDGICCVVDPWASPHELRLTPPPPWAVVAEGIDWVLVTHEHLDHLDPPVLRLALERSPTARLVLPGAIAPLVEDIVGSERVVAVQPGDVLDLGGVECRRGSGDPRRDDGRRVRRRQRAGGGAALRRLRARRRVGACTTRGTRSSRTPCERHSTRSAIDVALLPINGRDAEREARGIVGNMDAAEAVELAVAIGRRRSFPTTGTASRETRCSPGATADLAAGRLHVVVPSRFGAIELP